MIKIPRVFNLIKGKWSSLLCQLRQRSTLPLRFQHKCDELPCGTVTYKYKTGVLIVHPGEPATMCGIEKFLECIAKDKLFTYNMQSIWRPDGCLRSCEDMDCIYKLVGCYSPLLKCSLRLADTLEKLMDTSWREFAPHKIRVGFRYTKPYISEALKKFAAERVRHFVIINLEPHFCYQRAGPCFETIANYYSCHPIPTWSWTIIDRWPLRHLLCGAIAQRIQLELDIMPRSCRQDTAFVFVANNLPIENVIQGDLYPYEVGVTAMTTMKLMEYTNQYVLCWLPGRANCVNISPTIDETMEGMAKQGIKSFIIVPITCPCTNLDTLYELDKRHLRHMRRIMKCDAVVARADHPNYHRYLVECLSKVIHESMTRSRQKASPQFLTKCHGTAQQCCCSYVDFFSYIISEQDARRKTRVY